VARRLLLVIVVGAAVAAALWLHPTGSALAAKADRQCLRTCGAELRLCVGLAKDRRTAARAGCSGDARAACRAAVTRTFRAAKQRCRAFRKECRLCCKSGGVGPQCPVGRPVAFTAEPPPDPGASGLPRLENGNYLVMSLPGVELQLDPTLRDAVTVLGDCAGYATACLAPPERTLDDCIRSAPPCLGERPWEEAAPCCPAGCFTAYEAARRAGSSDLAAFQQVYFDDGSCIPGLRELLGR
jgi:hypothetical protein